MTPALLQLLEELKPLTQPGSDPLEAIRVFRLCVVAFAHEYEVRETRWLEAARVAKQRLRNIEELSFGHQTATTLGKGIAELRIAINDLHDHLAMERRRWNLANVERGAA